MLGGVTTAIKGMVSGSNEISHASDDLSRRTEQQAASLEQTAAALEQISATVQKTAESAHQVATVTSHARSEAEKSGHVVESAVSAMAHIAGSSNQISQITGHQRDRIPNESAGTECGRRSGESWRSGKGGCCCRSRGSRTCATLSNRREGYKDFDIHFVSTG